MLIKLQLYEQCDVVVENANVIKTRPCKYNPQRKKNALIQPRLGEMFQILALVITGALVAVDIFSYSKCSARAMCKSPIKDTNMANLRKHIPVLELFYQPEQCRHTVFRI